MFALVLWFVGTEVFAHDCFLMAKPFRTKSGSNVKISIHIDDLFPGKHVAWNPDRVTRFHHWYGRTLLDSVVPEPVEDSSGVFVSVEQPGLHLFVVDWSHRFIELEAKLFTKYLQSEGLDQIVQLRKEHNEVNKPGRERYSRYIKTFVTTGEGNVDAYRHIVGQALELIPLDNPYAKKIGDTLRVRLLFQGKPIAGAKVSATYEGATTKPDTHAQSVRTNKEGVAAFRITHKGVWLVRTVHMQAAETPEADWESWWASVTFEVR
ncbi:MAG: DUF4198 domain-containing protein [Bacteroidota bacterium]